MRKFLTMFLIAGSAASAHAQRQPIPVGARVKLMVFEHERQIETRFTRRLVIRGELTAQSAESIWVRPTPLTGVLSVPMSDVRRIYESRGAPSRMKSFFREGLAGAIVVGLEFGYFFNREFWGRQQDFGVGNHGEAIALGAGLGLVTFGAIGAIWPVEYWRLRGVR